MRKLATAQLPDGSVADFTATDINGVEHNLYSYLDELQVIWTSPPRGAVRAGRTTKAVCWKSSTTHMDLTAPTSCACSSSKETTAPPKLTWRAQRRPPRATGSQERIIPSLTTQNIYDAYSAYLPRFTPCAQRTADRIWPGHGRRSYVAVAIGGLRASSLPNDMLVGYSGDTFACGAFRPNLCSLAQPRPGTADFLRHSSVSRVAVQPNQSSARTIGKAIWTPMSWPSALTTLDIDDLVLQFDIVSDDDNTDNNQVLGGQLREQTVNNLQVRSSRRRTRTNRLVHHQRSWRGGGVSTLGQRPWAAKQCTSGCDVGRSGVPHIHPARHRGRRSHRRGSHPRRCGIVDCHRHGRRNPRG